MKGKFTENSPRITGLRGDNRSFMEDGFGADEMNRRHCADKFRQVRLLQRKRIADVLPYALRSVP